MRTELSVRPPIAVALMSAAILVLPGVSVGHAASAPPLPGPTIMAPTPSTPSTPSRIPDEQARDLFLSRRYREALEIYQRLRSETHHPTYLRNIGRCHQMLRQPSPAIDAFEGYLREARDLDTSERGEVEGYVAEMRQLEASPRPPASAVPPGALTWREANHPIGGSIGTAIAAQAPSIADTASSPSVVRRWWFWAGVAAVVVATGVVVAVAATGEDGLPCPAGAVCPR